MNPRLDPPRLAAWLLDRGLDPECAEAVGGDLEEEFRIRVVTAGAPAARRWFWRQTLFTLVARHRSRNRAVPGASTARHRKAGFMASWWHDLRFTFRMLRKAPGFALTAVVTLAIGIAGATIMLTTANWVWLRPLPFAQPEQLVHVGEQQQDGTVGNAGWLTIRDWAERSGSFETLLPIRGWTPTLADAAGARRLDGLRVGHSFFEMLGVRPALGRTFTEDEDAPGRWHVIVISDRLWRSQFDAQTDIVGQAVTFNDIQYQIIGVLPPDFEPLVSQQFYTRADVWAPLGYAPDGGASCRTCRHLRALGRLRPEFTPAAAAAELNVVHDSLRAEYPDDYGERPATMARVSDQVSGPFKRPLQILTGAVGFLLLMACANVTGLLIARASNRQREIAVRTALGASRMRVIRQLLTESFVLASVATGLGLGAAYVGLVWLVGEATGLPRVGEAVSDPGLALIAVGVGALALLLFGILPAFETVRPGLQAVVRASRQSSGRRATRIREAMVVAQVAIALLLLVGSGLMYRTVDRLLAVDPGFEPRGVLTTGLSLVGQRWATDESVYAFQQDLLARVSQLPGVESAGLTGLLPLGGSFDRRGFSVEGQTYETRNEVPSGERYSVTPEYFEAMGIELRRGRLLTAQDTRESEPVVLFNETAARTVLGDRDPIGLRVHLSLDGPPSTVVGLVADVRHYDLTTPPIAQMYVPQSQSTDSFLYLVVRAPATLDTLAGQIRREVAALASDVPVYSVRRLEDLMTGAVSVRRLMMQVLGLFATASLLMAAVGLYGVIAQFVRAREHELSIRASLGAGRHDLVGLVLRRTSRLLVVGLVLGTGLGALSARLLEAQLFQTATTDPLTYLVACGSLLMVGLLAHLAPLRRAASADPAALMRGD